MWLHITCMLRIHIHVIKPLINIITVITVICNCLQYNNDEYCTYNGRKHVNSEFLDTKKLNSEWRHLMELNVTSLSPRSPLCASRSSRLPFIGACHRWCQWYTFESPTTLWLWQMRLLMASHRLQATWNEHPQPEETSCPGMGRQNRRKYITRHKWA